MGGVGGGNSPEVTGVERGHLGPCSVISFCLTNHRKLHALKQQQVSIIPPSPAVSGDVSSVFHVTQAGMAPRGQKDPGSSFTSLVFQLRCWWLEGSLSFHMASQYLLV